MSSLVGAVSTPWDISLVSWYNNTSAVSKSLLLLAMDAEAVLHAGMIRTNVQPSKTNATPHHAARPCSAVQTV